MKKTNQRYSNGNDLIRWFVMACDYLIVTGILIAYMELCPKLVPHFFDTATKMTFFVAFAAMALAQYFYSTIIHIRQVTAEEIALRTTKLSLFYCTSMFLFLRLLSNGGGFFRFIIIYFASVWCLLLLSRFPQRLVLKYFRSLGRNTRSVVFVGSDPANLTMYNEMVNDPSTGYKVMGYYSNDKIKDAPESFKYLGTRSDLSNVIDKNMDFVANNIESKNQENENILPKCDEIFVSLSHNDSDDIIKIMRFCDKNVIRFYYVPRMFGNFRLNLKSERMFNQTIFTNRMEPLSSLGNRFIKRAFDIIVSGLVCLCFLPFFPIIALIIKIQSPGPIFFKQDRTGINGKTFKCLKFRSMHVSADADTKQATKDDPRKFAFGNLMRKTNIDEFPQFLNVLKGDMSIVGPRPHMLYHTEVYSGMIDKYMVRHFCKPGITGWAQVTGFRGETKELWQMEERVKRDIWYIENWSPLLDLRIIFKTAKTIIFPDKHAY